MNNSEKYRIFAPAMMTVDELSVDLQRVAKAGEILEFSLDNAFFQQLEQDEILGGSVKATVKARERANDFFQISFKLEGHVAVACDRCLDEVALPISCSDILLVGREENVSDDEDVRFFPDGSFKYNLAWDFYETIIIHLPIKRTHKEGECDPDMLSRFYSEEIDS